MQFRVGKCGSCQATFKVPASFGGDKAKCKSCGTGVVAIGPIEEEEEKLEEHKPSGKNQAGPSMMERLRSERSAAEPPPKPLPAKIPSAQKATDKGTSGPRKTSSRKPGDRRPGVSSKRVERPGRTTSRRAGATRGRGRKSATEDGDGEAGSRRGRDQKKKSTAPILGGVAVLAGVIILVLAVLRPWESEDTGAPATDVQVGQASPEQSPQDQAPEEEDTTPTEDAAAQEPVPEEPEPEPTKPTQKITVSTPDSDVDPNEIDLTSFEPLGKDPDCSDEQWAEIVDLALTMADQDSPRQANQAVAELALIGRFAYPAMVNEFLKLDLTDYEGHRQGDYYQRAMENLLGGRNYGWKYDFDTEPNKTALFNKKVVLNYYKTGGKVSGKPNAWNDLSKNEDNTNRPAPEPEVESGLSEDDLDDLDF